MALTSLVLAVIAFVATHLLLSHPLRARLVRRVGEQPFRGIYSAIALATFAWVVLAFRSVPKEAPAWVAGDALWVIAALVMWFASILFVGSFVRNPAFPAPGAEKSAAREPKGVFAITRHAMMWSFALWALVHALVWPTSANLVLTAGILVLAWGGSVGQDSRKKRDFGDAWMPWAERTAFVPFARQLGGGSPWNAAWPGAWVFAIGTLLWLLATWSHVLLGAPPAGIWRWVY